MEGDGSMSLTSARIRTINAVFEAGTFSAAARRLGISQPAVTQQVREVEAEFGVKLFDRRGNGLVPTAICRQLATVTMRIQSAESEAVSILRQHEMLSGGELRIGLGNSMPGMTLVAAFIRAYPNISIQVEMGSWASIIDAIVDQRVDVAVLPEVPDDGRFRREVCLRQKVVAIVHTQHVLARAGSVACAELAHERLIFRTRQSSTQRVVDHAFRTVGIAVSPVITLDTREGVLEAVANRIGVGFTWQHGSSRTDTITKLDVAELSSESPEHIFCLSDNRSKLVELFFRSPLSQGFR
jgi:DNA-binding transcriptional LysR family regulator